MIDGVKKPWLSKTLWLNAIAAVLALAYPPAAEWLSANATLAASVLAGANIILRLVTKDRIGLD